MFQSFFSKLDGLAAALSLLRNEHIHVPETELPEPWYARVWWLAIGGVVIFIVTLACNLLLSKARGWASIVATNRLADRWRNRNGQILLDIPAKKNSFFRLSWKGDDLELVPSSDQIKEPYFLLTGKIKCYKNGYETGTFVIRKQAGSLNDVELEVNFDDGRTGNHHLWRA